MVAVQSTVLFRITYACLSLDQSSTDRGIKRGIGESLGGENAG